MIGNGGILVPLRSSVLPSCKARVTHTAVIRLDAGAKPSRRMIEKPRKRKTSSAPRQCFAHAVPSTQVAELKHSAVRFPISQMERYLLSYSAVLLRLRRRCMEQSSISTSSLPITLLAVPSACVGQRSSSSHALAYFNALHFRHTALPFSLR